MKRSFFLIFCAAALMACLFLAGRPRHLVEAAGLKSTVVFIRFGLDGVKDVDWSGAVGSAARVTGWQLDPPDEVAGTRWRCKTREQTYWDTPYERRMRPTSNRDKVTGKGVFVELDEAQASRPVEVTTAQGDFTFVAKREPQRFLNGRVEVRVAPQASRLTTGPDAEDYPSLAEATDGTLWLAYQSYTAGGGDQIFVRRRVHGVWSDPEPLAEANGDYFRTAVAADGKGTIWVVWSAQVNSNFDLYARAWDGKRWSARQRLTSAAGSDIFHVLARDPSGKLYLAYQSSRNGNFDIYLRTYDGRRWSPEMQVSSDPADDWEPALAVAPDGRVTIVWDTYAKGNYDVVARTLEKGSLGPIVPIAESGAFEARASAQYDREGRLWMAFEEGDWNWGKDYGNLIPESGRGLITRRQARIAVMAGGKVMEPAARLADAVPEDLQQVFHQPRLVLDGKGTPWVFFRYRVNLPRAGSAAESQRAMWRLCATGLQNGRWTPAVEMPAGYGRIDAPAAVLANGDGNIDVVWTADGRLWPHGVPVDQDLWGATIPAAAAAFSPELVEFTPSSENLPVSHPQEAADVARIRNYRVSAGGQTFRIARGDVHRHTDISWDGNRDGSLNDSYRYALDAAALDYLGVCDHQAGQMIPYNWWMIQKAADLYTISGRFTPLYSYERSLPYPNGHRNVLFASRGHPVLAISQPEERGEEGAAKLYAYLRRLGGITSAHTTATGAGTDWRDSDAQVEPVVEIYQGYRNNYEGPGVPRQPDRSEQQRFAKGFVWNAWAKGIKLGVQSSSDHVSTHISYASLLVDRLDREALLAAFQSRRAFAATDNIIVDFRMGGRLMGESFSASGPQSIRAYVAGTGPLAAVSLVKNNRIVYTAPGVGAEMDFRFTDTQTEPGDSYYYLRVEQKDGQMAWSSPIWVRY